MHGVNDVILSTGLAVDYEQVSSDAEKLRLAMKGQTIEDFTIDGGRVLTAKLMLNGQEAQKSHGLCRGTFHIAIYLLAKSISFLSMPLANFP